jgi:hypothetical protein
MAYHDQHFGWFRAKVWFKAHEFCLPIEVRVVYAFPIEFLVEGCRWPGKTKRTEKC